MRCKKLLGLALCGIAFYSSLNMAAKANASLREIWPRIGFAPVAQKALPNTGTPHVADMHRKAPDSKVDHTVLPPSF